MFYNGALATKSIGQNLALSFSYPETSTRLRFVLAKCFSHPCAAPTLVHFYRARSLFTHSSTSLSYAYARQFRITSNDTSRV